MSTVKYQISIANRQTHVKKKFNQIRCKAMKSKAKQSKAEQWKAKQSKAKQCKEMQSNAKQ